MTLRKPALLLGCVALAFVPALSGVVAHPDGWYAALAKPPFHPPAWIFGPVWTALYLSIGYAHFRFLSAPGGRRRLTGNILYGVQLALNAGWTPLFFALHAPLAGLPRFPQRPATLPQFVPGLFEVRLRAQVQPGEASPVRGLDAV